MNINTLRPAPHVHGIIKVRAETDPATNNVTTQGEFEVCSRLQSLGEDGLTTLRRHEAHAALVQSAQPNKDDAKLVEIPIRIFFNKANNALSMRYQAYSVGDNRPACSGDGKDARRLTVAGDHTETFTDVPCPGAETCAYAASGEVVCRRQVRMAVQVPEHCDPLSVFEVRSSSINTYRSLAGQLAMLEHRYGGLRHIPLKLKLWQASNEASGYEAFDLMRVEIDAKTEQEAMKVTKDGREALAAVGLNDDMDAVFNPGQAPDAFFAQDDYALSSDFYRGTQAPRRQRRAATVVVAAVDPVAPAAPLPVQSAKAQGTDCEVSEQGPVKGVVAKFTSDTATALISAALAGATRQAGDKPREETAASRTT